MNSQVSAPGAGHRDQPALASYYEARTYSQILPDGKAYRFYFLQEVKSFISQPSTRPPAQGTRHLRDFRRRLCGGTGRIAKGHLVSADGGKSWAEAASRSRGCPRPSPASACHGDGTAARRSCGSRAFDEARNMQPTLGTVRGPARPDDGSRRRSSASPASTTSAITSWAFDEFVQGRGPACLCVRSAIAAIAARRSWRSRPARRGLAEGPDLETEPRKADLRRPTSRRGTSQCSRTAPTCRPAAARPPTARQNLCRKMRGLPWRQGPGRHCRPGHRRTAQGHARRRQDHREFLARRHHPVRLHPQGHALHGATLADRPGGRRCVDGLSSRRQQARSAKNDEINAKDAASGEDAEPR